VNGEEYMEEERRKFPDVAINAYHISFCRKAFDDGSKDALGPLLAALAWSGGTVEQVVAEVGRLRREHARYAAIYDLPPDPNGDDDRFWKCPKCSCQWYPSRTKCLSCGESQPLGQGVAALLPEHGEVTR